MELTLLAHPVMDLPLAPLREAFMDRLWFNMAMRTEVPRNAQGELPRDAEGRLETAPEIEELEMRDRLVFAALQRDFSGAWGSAAAYCSFLSLVQ